MNKDREKKTKRLSIILSFEEHYEIKNTASKLGITMTQLINDALFYYAKHLKNTEYKNYKYDNSKL